MAKNFSDPAISMRMRDVIERIVKGVLSRERPESFLGEVQSFNIFTRKALIRTTGMSVDDDFIEVKFGNNIQPNTAGSGFGNVVSISGKPGDYWIERVISGEWRATSARLVNPRFNGGDFNHIEMEAWYHVDLNTQPAAGQTVHLGTWDNAGFTLWSNGSAFLEIEIGQELFTNLRKKYRISLDQGGSLAWQSVFPTEDHGVVHANDFGLEIKIFDSKFDLRIRRFREGVWGTSTYSAHIKIMGQLFYMDSALRNVVTSDPYPTEVFGRNEVNQSEDVAGRSQKGPWNDTHHHTTTVRTASNLISPTSIKWNGQYLGWSGEFILGGIGKGEVSGNGTLRIAQPATGTTYFLHGTPDIFGTRDTTVDGFDMRFESAGPNALYYEPLFFTSDGVQPANRFHMVATTSPFKVPSHWILLAIESVASNNGNSLMLGNGQQHDHWRVPVYQNSWANYGTPYSATGYRKIGNMVEGRGLIRLGSPATAVMFNLPAPFRPAEDKILVVLATTMRTGAQTAGTAHTHPLANLGTRLNIRVNGDVDSNSLDSSGYVSLEQVRFEAAT